MFETHALQIDEKTFLVEIAEIRPRRVCEECATASPSRICPKCGEDKRNEKVRAEFKVYLKENGLHINPPLTAEQYNRPANFLKKIRVAIESEHAYDTALRKLEF